MNRVKILRASAGSGKTYRLAYEYIKTVIGNPRSYASILAVTFTNKATAEMKSRILDQLDGLTRGESPYLDGLLRETGISKEIIKKNAADARSRILHDYSHFAVSTIDKFFQTIIRGFIKELGLDFGYKVELNDDAYLDEAIDRMVERGMNDPEIGVLISRVLGDSIENSKNWDVRPSLKKLGEELRKESFQFNEKSPEELIESHTHLTLLVRQKTEVLSQAAKNIITLIEQRGLDLSDFKGSSRSFTFIFQKLSQSDFEVTIERLAKASISPEEWYTKTSSRRTEIEALVPELMVMTEQLVTELKSHMLDYNSLRLLDESFNRNLLLRYISEELQKLWSERNKLPIHQTSKLIGQLVAETPVPFIYEKSGNRFDYYMIDEFQDTSTRQWHNFIPLLDDARSKSNDQSVMLIGDVKQAIYRWRGGDWDILARGAIDHFDTDADHSEQLATNWRSLPEVVAFNNHLLREVVQAADNSTLTRVYQDFEQSVPPDKTGGYVRVAEIPEQELEQTILESVANAIARGYRQRDIAFLVRTGKQGKGVAEILLNGGYSIIDQDSLLLTNSKEVNIIISLLQYAFNREDEVSLARFNYFSGNEFKTPFEDKSLLNELLLMAPLEAVDKLILNFDLGAEPNQASYLQAFYQIVFNYCNDNIPDLRLFLSWWEENGTRQSLYLPLTGDAITIITIHKSKGLQFPCVIIPRCDWALEPISSGLFQTTIWANSERSDFKSFNPAPIIYKKLMAESHYRDDYILEQEYSLIDAVNLLYVATTRAERELYIYYPPKGRGSGYIYSLMEQAGITTREYGKKEAYTPIVQESSQKRWALERFTLNSSTQKVVTHWNSERYYEDGGVIETPLSYGILMHQIFSEIDHISDVEKVIKRMIVSGELSTERAERLRVKIREKLSDPMVNEWFDPKWKLYNENPILIPNSSSTLRPDRVVVDGNSAIVIDYKFGEQKSTSYIKQVKGYKSVLSEMGYSNIKGYLWYMELDKIEEVL